MSFHHGHPRTLVPVLAAGLLIMGTGCAAEDVGVVGDPVTEAPSRSTGPGTPEVGRCYRMTSEQSEEDTHDGPPVECDQPHQTRTYHVGTMPANARAYDSEEAARQCTEVLPDALGLTQQELDSSVLGVVFFGPDDRQWEEGARWFRCDVAAFSPAGLGVLPDVDLADGLPDSLVRCLREVPQAPGYVEVTCDQAHDYRWAGAFEGVGEAYPGDDVIRQQAAARCPALTGGDDWYAVWQDPVAWASGFRRVECFGPADTV